MIVKIAPIGERVVEYNTINGESVGAILQKLSIPLNGRQIVVDDEVKSSDYVPEEGDVIILANKAKAGK